MTTLKDLSDNIHRFNVEMAKLPPSPVRFVAEPSTLARFIHALRLEPAVYEKEAFGDPFPLALAGIPLCEDKLPPRPPGWIDMIDKDGQIMRRCVLPMYGP